MRRGVCWIVTALPVLLLLGGGMTFWTTRPTLNSQPVTVLAWQPDSWYRLDRHGSEARCELPPGHRYRLVIGCLGDAASEHSVQLNWEPLSVSAAGRQSNDAGMERLQFDRDRQLIRSKIVAVSPARPATRQDPLKKIPSAETRDFYLHVTDGDLDDPKQYAQIRTRHMVSGRCVRVFLDQQLPDGEVPIARLRELVEMLDEDVVPRIEARFGPLHDTDGDGRLAIVLTPWLSRLQGGRTAIGGLVRGSDFRPDVTPPWSNRCDMLFLNSSLPATDALRDLLSHEVAHAACISQRVARRSSSICEEHDWLSEALAHLAEPGWSNLDHRVAAFLADTERYPLVVPDYYRAGLWRNAGCRGATFLFARWCTERHGSDVVRQLAQSSKCGRQNVEQATGRRFDDLFREWSLWLASGGMRSSPELSHLLDRCGVDGVGAMTCQDVEPLPTRQIRGTAFTVVDVCVGGPDSRLLSVVGSAGARWQFSICRLPEALPSPSTPRVLTAQHR